jgi:hypothetical protein
VANDAVYDSGWETTSWAANVMEVMTLCQASRNGRLRTNVKLSKLVSLS